jgi:hypothetical protein
MGGVFELARQVPRPVHGAGQAVAGAHRQHGGGIRQDRRCDNQREDGERVRLRVHRRGAATRGLLGETPHRAATLLQVLANQLRHLEHVHGCLATETTFKGTSALIIRLFLGSCRLFFLM